MRITLPLVALMVASSGWLCAQMAEPNADEGGEAAETPRAETPGAEAPVDVAAIRAELGEVEEQIQVLEERLLDLEQKRIALEDRLAGEKTEAELMLEAIKADSTERLADYEAELDGLKAREADEDDPPGLAWREYAKQRRAHLLAATDIDRLVQVLNGPDAVDKAQDLLWDIERLDTRWWMVAEPNHGRAVEIEEMENAALARDDRTLFELIRKARAAQTADAERGEKLYELWLQRTRSDREIGELMETFWDRVADDEQTEEQDPKAGNRD